MAYFRCVPLQVIGNDLPTGYKRCKYLESSGKQYISTGIYGVNETDSFTLEYRLLSSNVANGEANFFGFDTGSLYYDYNARHGDKGGKAEVAWSAVVNTKAPLSIDDVHTVNLSANGVVTIDNTVIGKLSKASNPNISNQSHALFARFRNNIPRFYGVVKIYDFSFERNGSVIAKYIPAVRISDNKPGMYDIASKQFFVNKGTGEFGYETMDGTYVAPI